MDADYLKNTVGLVVARACSAVVAAEPPDPIAYLSLWLLKYIQNVSILDNFHEEKRMRAEMEKQSEHKLKEAKLQEELEESRRKAAVDNVRNIKDDPYLLWDACLNAISTFTGNSSIIHLWTSHRIFGGRGRFHREAFCPITPLCIRAKRGMHFFGGIPRVGAYFVVPITLKTAPSQVAALLCADTLKVERYGTGRPFSESDVIFITAIADSISDVMNANHSKITNKPMTEVLIKRIQVQLQQIKDQREETLKKAIADTKALQRLSKLEVQGNNQGDDDKEHKDDEELDEGKDEVEEGQEEGEEDEVEEEEEMAEDDAKAEDEEEEQEEEEEVYPEEGEDAIKDRRKLYLKDLRKEIAKYRKMVTIAEKNCEKLKNAIEIRGQKVGRLEVKLSKSKDYIQHFQNLLAIVIETIIEVKETEQPQILCWPFPSTNIFRILKANSITLL
ncbi:hypothetical protein O6H91_Y270000 [Diphasiastrum complanatum]|nr:hypothetical protein O6H91_Y270000 [Diphasiastrum complanatum]